MWRHDNYERRWAPFAIPMFVVVALVLLITAVVH